MMERNITDLKEKPHWSYSAFNTYLQCPMKYYFRYIEHAEVERTGVCFPFGRAFHAVLSERAMKGAEFTLEDTKDDFNVYFRGETEAAENLKYKADESYESCLQKGYEMLDLAFNNWQDDFVVKSVPSTSLLAFAVNLIAVIICSAFFLLINSSRFQFDLDLLAYNTSSKNKGNLY